MDIPPSFQGMSREDFLFLKIEALQIVHQARVHVLSCLVARILRSGGVKDIQNMPVETYILSETKREIDKSLAALADHDPSGVALISKFLESVPSYNGKDIPSA